MDQIATHRDPPRSSTVASAGALQAPGVADTLASRSVAPVPARCGESDAACRLLGRRCRRARRGRRSWMVPGARKSLFKESGALTPPSRLPHLVGGATVLDVSGGRRPGPQPCGAGGGPASTRGTGSLEFRAGDEPVSTGFATLARPGLKWLDRAGRGQFAVWRIVDVSRPGENRPASSFGDRIDGPTFSPPRSGRSTSRPRRRSPGAAPGSTVEPDLGRRTGRQATRCQGHRRAGRAPT
jgi:hypothetical protein